MCKVICMMRVCMMGGTCAEKLHSKFISGMYSSVGRFVKRQQCWDAEFQFWCIVMCLLEYDCPLPLRCILCSTAGAVLHFAMGTIDAAASGCD